MEFEDGGRGWSSRMEVEDGDGDGDGDNDLEIVDKGNETGQYSRSRRFSSIRFGWVADGTNLVNIREIPTLLALVCLYLHHNDRGDVERDRLTVGELANPQASLMCFENAENGEKKMRIVVETDETREELRVEELADVRAIIESGHVLVKDGGELYLSDAKRPKEWAGEDSRRFFQA